MKQLLIIFTLCITAALAFYVNVEEESKLTPVASDSRIIQGQPAVNGQFPFMAWVDVSCGGSLISPLWMLTAAHCVYNSSRPTVYMGDVNLTMSPVQAKGVKVHLYPDPSRDIALIGFDSPVPLSDRVKPIRIASNPEDTFSNAVATVAGFGYINDNDDNPDVLQYVDVRVLPNEECKEYWAGFDDFYLCTRGIKNATQGTCFGDSGSGLFLRRPDGDILIGITSYFVGESCEEKVIAGFPRTTHVLDWIKEHTGLEF